MLTSKFVKGEIMIGDNNEKKCSVCDVYAPCGEFTLKGKDEEKKINLCYGCYLKLFEKEEKE